MEGAPAQTVHTCSASGSYLAMQMFPSLPETWQVQPAPSCPWVCLMQILINLQRFQCSGSLAKTRLITAPLPFSTASIFDVLYTHLLLTKFKITYPASISSHKQWPWVYSLKNSQEPFLHFTILQIQCSAHKSTLTFYFHRVSEIPLPQKIPKLFFSWPPVSGLRVCHGSEAHKQSTLRF